MAGEDAGRRVVVCALGGTIAMADDGGGAVPALGPDRLVAAVPGLADTGIVVDTVEFRQVPGASLTLADVAALSERIAALLAGPGDDIDGIVVTQGTDTIEETAYLLDLAHAGPEPIVVTGAMRNPSLAGADGPANLLAAIEVAASPAARDLGCVVVFADEIHAAARVRKTHSTGIGAFTSPNGGPLGQVVEGRVRLWQRPAGRLVLPPTADERPARVVVVPLALGDDGLLLDGLAERADGIVIAAFGAGHAPAALVDPLTELAARRPVVLASRTTGGPILTGTYGFAGAERDLIGRGLIPAGFLDPFKARLLLYRLLAAGADHARIRAIFESS